MGNKNALNELFAPRHLPCEAFAHERSRLVRSTEVWRRLSRYADLLTALQLKPQKESPLNRFVIFEGPPGTGKTMTAGAFSQDLAEGYRDHHACRTVFLTLRMSSFFSEMLGKTSKIIAEAFEMIAFAAARQHVIVLADELETLAFSRARLSTGDPSDVVRGVNELLAQLDRLRTSANFLCIGTTNLGASLDRALLDRADFELHFPYPDVDVGLKILLQAASDARHMKIRVAKDDLRLAAEELCAANNGARPSGRLLAKLPLLTYLESRSARITAREMIEVARHRLNGREGMS